MASAPHPAFVRLAQGDLQGIGGGPVLAWLGVPYARPPTGQLRFRAPQPPCRWKGVRQAADFGAACAQHPPFWGNTRRFLGPSLSEDCLTLNIWSPKADNRRRPVMFWVHGGGFTSGSAKIYRGGHLAEEGDIVVITVNYRLGVFGFVNFADLIGDPGCVSQPGLRDLIQALRWVRENIAHFGGDPDRITIAGESAGSVAVSMLLIADAAKGLLHGAIMQSGTFSLIHSQAKSASLAAAYLEALGLKNPSLADLQKCSPEQLLAAQSEMVRRFPGSSPAAAWFDGQLVPIDLQGCQARETAPVPLLSGTNHDEISLFALPGPSILPSRRADLQALLIRQFGEAEARAILAVYPCTRHGERQLGTDLNFTMPQIHFSERHKGKSYFYRFDYKMPILGAAHALEILFLFDQQSLLSTLLRGGPLTGARLALAKRMRRAWIAFIRTGSPGPGWPPYEAGTHTTKIFDLQDSLTGDPEQDRRLRWAGRDIALGSG